MIGMIVLLMGIAQLAMGATMMQSVEMMVFGVFMLLGGFYLYNLERFTPGPSFLKARRKKADILEVERKDGSLEYDVPEYMVGSAISEKYGIFTVNPEDVKNERKSGVKVLHCVEGVGATISTDMIRIIKAVKEQYGVNSYNELIELANHWHICLNEKCGHIGVFEKEEEDITNEKTGELLSTNIIFKCPKCGEKGQQFEPELRTNGENIEAGWIDRYFKQVHHPMQKRIIVNKMAQNIAMKDKKALPIASIAIIISLGMMFFLVAIGIMILLPNIETYQAAQAAKLAAEVVPPVIVG
jgi:hypothetical protein